MIDCPFCKSENIEILSSWDSIDKAYQKENNFGGMYSREEGTFKYPIIKAICLDCGNVFQKMNEENLQKYQEEKQFFK